MAETTDDGQIDDDKKGSTPDKDGSKPAKKRRRRRRRRKKTNTGQNVDKVLDNKRSPKADSAKPMTDQDEAKKEGLEAEDLPKKQEDEQIPSPPSFASPNIDNAIPHYPSMDSDIRIGDELSSRPPIDVGPVEAPRPSTPEFVPENEPKPELAAETTPPPAVETPPPVAEPAPVAPPEQVQPYPEEATDMDSQNLNTGSEELEAERSQEIPQSSEVADEEVQKEVRNIINDPSHADEQLDEALKESSNLGSRLRSVFFQVGPFLRRIFDVKLLILVVVIGGGWWAFSQGFHTGISNWVGGLIGSGGPSVEQPVEGGDESEPNVLQEYGIASVLLFGDNRGAKSDLLPSQIFVVDFFGTLSEPQIDGETGITPVTYFGDLMDERGATDLFVLYVDDLETIQSLYSIDVYDLLDRSSQRSSALDEYLGDLQEVESQAQLVMRDLGVQIDELTVSYNSISGDKDQYENDFFVALQDLEGNKSDTLLKSFIDVSQKQVALRARVAALQKLQEYFEQASERLSARIEAVQGNREALIQGIRVVDIPEGRIDIIIRP